MGWPNFVYGHTGVGTGVVQLVSGLTISPFLEVKALSTNAGICYIGRNGSVATTSGYPLSASNTLLIDTGEDSSKVWAVANTNGNTISYLGKMRMTQNS